MLLFLTGHTIHGSITVITMDRYLLTTWWFPVPAIAKGGEFQTLGPQVEEFEEVFVVGDNCGSLAVTLPLECNHWIELQFEKQGNRGSRRIMPERLQSS